MQLEGWFRLHLEQRDEAGCIWMYLAGCSIRCDNSRKAWGLLQIEEWRYGLVAAGGMGLVETGGIWVIAARGVTLVTAGCTSRDRTGCS